MRRPAIPSDPGTYGFVLWRVAVVGTAVALLLFAWGALGLTTNADGESDAGSEAELSADAGSTPDADSDAGSTPAPESDKESEPEEDPKPDPKKGSGPGEKLEVIGGTDGRTVELVACPKGEGDEGETAGSPPNPCSQPIEDSWAHIGGRITLLLKSKGKLTLEASYAPAGGGEPIELPADSSWVFLAGDLTQSQGFLDSLLDGVSGELKGKLLEKVESALPELARMAIDRIASAKRLAGSPALAKIVAGMLKVGVDKVAPAQIQDVAPALAQLIAPRGREVSLSSSETRSLLSDLEKTLVPPGAELAGVALEGAFEVAAEAVASSPPTLEEGEVRPLTIGFAIPPGELATNVDGNLILNVTDGADGKSEVSVVPIDGTVRQFKQLSVRPQVLKMNSDQEEATVTLAGADLGEFLAFGGFGRPTAVLNEDGGEAAEVELRLKSAEEVSGGDNPNGTKAIVRLISDDVSPGTYKGQLATSELIPEAPVIEIEMSSGRSFPVMVVYVFLGVFFVGLLTQIVTYAIRRRLLLKVLEQSEDSYRHVRCQKDGEAVASWNLGDLLGHPQDEVEEFRLHGVQGLIKSIRAARSSADLDEDTERVLDMVARIQRWLRLEPAARRLALVDAEADPKEKLGDNKKAKDWRESNTRRDTQLLREIGRREPADAKAADDLVWRLLRQAEWHHRMAAVWEAAAKADAEIRLQVEKLDEDLGAESKAGTRTPEEQDALDARLEALLHRLSLGDVDNDMPYPKEPPEDPKSGVTPVKWEASPNLFTGWATLDGKSYGQLAGRASRGARGLGFGDVKTELCAYGVPGLAWSVVTIVLASVAYGLGEFSDTWGSGEDKLNAFLAGALGTVVIDWAALPIFQSIRLRASQAGAGKESKDGEQDKGGEGSEKDEGGKGGGKAAETDKPSGEETTGSEPEGASKKKDQG